MRKIYYITIGMMIAFIIMNITVDYQQMRSYGARPTGFYTYNGRKTFGIAGHALFHWGRYVAEPLLVTKIPPARIIMNLKSYKDAKSDVQLTGDSDNFPLGKILMCRYEKKIKPCQGFAIVAPDGREIRVTFPVAP